MTINEKIKAVRSFKGVKQKNIAEALGLTVQAYSLKERGKRPITTTELEIIANKLNVPITIFFEDNFNVKFNDLFPRPKKKEVS